MSVTPESRPEAVTPPLPKPHRMRLAVIVAGLTTLGPFTIDTYFPSFPAIAKHFDVSTGDVQQTLSVYLATYALMLLFHGFLSDCVGRRGIILVSLVAYTLFSIGCVYAPSFEWLVIFRGFQGLCAGAGMTVGRAVIRDHYEGAHAQSLMAQVTMIFGIAPVIAPIIGGWLEVGFGWQSVFWFMALMGIVMLVLSWVGLEESHPVHLRGTFRLDSLMKSYAEIVPSRQFLMLALSVAFASAGYLIYVSAAPGFLMDILHLKETEFAWMFTPLVTGVIFGSFLASRMSHQHPPEKLMKIGFYLIGAAAVLNLIYTFIFPASLPWAILALPLYATGASLQSPAATLKALDLFPHKRGLASSLQGFVTMALFSLLSGFIASHLDHSAPKLAVAMAVAFGVNLLCWVLYLRFRRDAEARLEPIETDAIVHPSR